MGEQLVVFMRVKGTWNIERQGRGSPVDSFKRTRELHATVDNVRVCDRGHDLNLSPDPHQVLLGLNFRLLDRLDGHLKE